MNHRRVVFIQHGDYRETVHRFQAGLGETCGAQRYSVDFVAELLRDVESATVVCVSAGPYDERLPNGVRGVGIPLKGQPGVSTDALTGALDDLAPTHLVLRTPMVTVLDWARGRDLRILAMLADSFAGGLRGRMRHRRLAKALGRPEVEWIGNHNVSASRTLSRLGVAPEKIVPWDWPAERRPEESAVRSLRSDGPPYDVFYAGAMSEAKGVGDVVRAVSFLQRFGLECRLTLAGHGDPEPFLDLARSLGVDDLVRFAGRLEHDDVLDRMRATDVVVVPSRREYPEGSPKTVNEALACRTPLVVSDHPVFEGRIEDGLGALVFHAGDAEHLADRIRELLTRPDLYERLSRDAPEAFRRIEHPTVWGEVIRRWLRDSDEDREWLRSRTLAELDRRRVPTG